MRLSDSRPLFHERFLFMENKCLSDRLNTISEIKIPGEQELIGNATWQDLIG